MKIFKSNRWMGLLISLVFIFSLCVAFSTAQEKMKTAGKATITYTVQETIDVDDTEGHVLLISKIEGTNVSTGEHKFMDGAKVVVMGFGDYVKGNGPHLTYLKMSLNGDVVFAKGKGKTKTTLSPEGKPISTLEGTATYTKGEGKYKNIQGGYTYKAKRISSTEIVVEMEGKYFIKE